MIRFFLLLCLCLPVFGCSARQTTLQGNPVAEIGDDWQTNRVVIRAAESSGNVYVALAAATEEVAARPGNDEARVVLARLLTRTGQPQQALITLEPVENQSAPDTLLEKGRAELAMGNVAPAAGLLDQCLASSPPPAQVREAHKLRAVAFDLSGEHAAAQGLYRSLLGERDDVGVRYNYGRSLIASGDYKQAVSMLLPLVELYEIPQARFAAAAAMAGSDDREGARNLLHGLVAEDEISRMLGGEKP
jgi:Flp pilus assembly protein TadD